MYLVSEYLHRSELGIDSRLDLEAIPEEYITLLCEDREDKLVVVLETVGEVFECHDGVFYLFPKKCLFQKIIELYLIELTDDKYIDNIIGILIAEVENSLRDSHKIESFPSLKKLLDRSHNIIRLEKHLTEFVIYRTIMIHHVVFFLVLLV